MRRKKEVSGVTYGCVLTETAMRAARDRSEWMGWTHGIFGLYSRGMGNVMGRGAGGLHNPGDTKGCVAVQRYSRTGTGER